MKIDAFEELEVWQKSRAFTNLIYDLSEKERFSRDFRFKSQITDAALSIMSNIAEGKERDGDKEFSYFLSVAKGSAGEVRSQLYLALDRNYISQEEFDDAKEKAVEISRMLNGLMKYLKNSSLKGRKF